MRERRLFVDFYGIVRLNMNGLRRRMDLYIGNGGYGMIYTVTFNPSLDYIVSVDKFRLGVTNRTVSEMLLPGGKGLNVSMALGNLGIASVALGFAAGFTGEEIVRRAKELGVWTDFIFVREGVSRINVKLKTVEGTEINGSGPKIKESDVEKLMGKLDALGEGDVLALAGSIPSSMPDDMYGRILERLKGKGVLTAVDAAKELLLKTLLRRPFFVKPNHHELGEIFGVAFQTREEVKPYAVKLKEMGARNVLVSMAGEGAVLAAEDGRVFSAPAPEGKLKNSVGAGDSMLDGFLAGWLEKKDYQYAFDRALSAGSASAFSDFMATRPEIEAVYRQIMSKRREGGDAADGLRLEMT